MSLASPQQHPTPAYWQARIANSPALGKLQAHVKREKIYCWVLVGLAAISVVMCSILFAYLILILLVGLGVLANEYVSANSMESALGTGVFLVQLLITLLTTIIAPAAIVGLSILMYHRRKRVVLSDLLYGTLALALVDETYGHEIEAQRQQRYRPNVRPVALGNDLVSRVNHLAYFFACYLRISKMPVELSVPMATQSGFWVLASLFCGSMCITPIGCLYILPVVLRTLLIWPRVTATKQAVLEFLSGKHDAAFEDYSAKP